MDFARVLAFHTQGEVIYWGFETLNPLRMKSLPKNLQELADTSQLKLRVVMPAIKIGLFKTGEDQVSQFELGTGVNPLPLTQFDEIYEEALGIFLSALYQ